MCLSSPFADGKFSTGVFASAQGCASGKKTACWRFFPLVKIGKMYV